MLYILQVLGGVALFLLGVGTLSEGMEKLAGNRIQVWLDRMRNLQDCARSGLHGVAFVTAAGYLASSFNPEWDLFESQDRYCYGSFLLAVTSNRAISLGLGATLRKSGSG